VASYQNLKAWKHAQHLAVECARDADQFPPTERTELALRLRRSAYDVSLGVAAAVCLGEGSVNGPELDAARVALAQVETALAIARDLQYIQMTRFARLEALAEETSKMLFGLHRRLQADRQQPQDAADSRSP